MDEWLMVAAIYLGIGVVAVLVWLAVFAVFGTAITALIDRITRLFRSAPAQPSSVDDRGDPDGTQPAEVSETDRLRSMLHSD